MNIAVIPARGGSKRIPRKNIKDFCGKPMIAWSIEVARNSGLFDRIIVSTDDVEISNIAKQWGAEVPFIRPAELADDHAGLTEVMAHATVWGLEQNPDMDGVCCIFATAPFMLKEDIARGKQQLDSGDWMYAFGVTDFPAPIFRSFQSTDQGGIQMFFPEHFSTRSQDLPLALHDAGQFCWGRPQAWMNGVRVFDQFSTPVLIPRWRVQDIDTEDDWTRAELLAPSIIGVSHKR